MQSAEEPLDVRIVTTPHVNEGAGRPIAVQRAGTGQTDPLGERAADLGEAGDLDHSNAPGCVSSIAATTAAENLSRASLVANETTDW